MPLAIQFTPLEPQEDDAEVGDGLEMTVQPLAGNCSLPTSTRQSLAAGKALARTCSHTQFSYAFMRRYILKQPSASYRRASRIEAVGEQVDDAVFREIALVIPSAFIPVFQWDE